MTVKETKIFYSIESIEVGKFNYSPMQAVYFDLNECITALRLLVTNNRKGLFKPERAFRVVKNTEIKEREIINQ